MQFEHRAAVRSSAVALVLPAALTAVGLLVGTAAVFIVPRLEEAHQDVVVIEMANLGLALQRYQKQVGSWPAPDAGLAPLVALGLLERPPIDPWRHPYRYGLRGSDGDIEVRVSSAGKDGLFGTADDLGACLPSGESVAAPGHVRRCDGTGPRPPGQGP